MEALALLWLASGIFSYGTMFAYFQREYWEIAKESYTEDMIFCFLAAMVGGPFGLPVPIWKFFKYRHGFKLF